MNAAWQSIELALTGGVIIGVAVFLMLWMNGRVTGISEIFVGAMCAGMLAVRLVMNRQAA
jgi:uncharacterized membrane protein YedE/YeeE